MFISDKWKDFELIDCSKGEKLERWGKYTLVRPDPQAIWDTPRRDPRWKQRDGRYQRSESGGGSWDKSALPESWQITYGELRFNVKPMNFKHTGIFPEQACNWDWAAEKIRGAKRPVSVLNLFGYTGAATLACAKAGASVCHVDAAKGMVAWGRENAQLSGLGEAPIRWIVDDCAKFVEREIRRERRYDAIIMDPPSYGRGPGGEVWKLEDTLYDLVCACEKIFREDGTFFLINSYTTGFAPGVLDYLLKKVIAPGRGGVTEADEIGLPVSAGPNSAGADADPAGLYLPCGSSGRWSFR
jgi:23S rRNA (cytosine1962-C5)-methyltransferase